MKNYCLSAVVAVLLLSAGGFRADYAQESSKETAIVESDHAVFPDGLKLTLEVCPTEIYMGDVVFLALCLENASDKTFDNFASIEDRLKSASRLGRISVSCSQLENEYEWKSTIYQQRTSFNSVSIQTFVTKSCLQRTFNRITSNSITLRTLKRRFSALRETSHRERIRYEKTQYNHCDDCFVADGRDVTRRIQFGRIPSRYV